MTLPWNFDYLLFTYGITTTAGLLLLAGLGLHRRAHRWSTLIFTASSASALLCEIGKFAIFHFFPMQWHATVGNASSPWYFSLFTAITRVELLSFLAAGLALTVLAFRKPASAL